MANIQNSQDYITFCRLCSMRYEHGFDTHAYVNYIKIIKQNCIAHFDEKNQVLLFSNFDNQTQTQGRIWPTI